MVHDNGKQECNDEAQIRALVDDWARAIRAKDVDGVLRHYAPDLVHFSLAPPLA
jgi:ketosteroid isomerase-like protein